MIVRFEILLTVLFDSGKQKSIFARNERGSRTSIAAETLNPLSCHLENQKWDAGKDRDTFR